MPAMVVPIRRHRRLSVAVVASLIFIAGSITVVLSLRHGARYFTKDGLPQESYPMQRQKLQEHER